MATAAANWQNTARIKSTSLFRVSFNKKKNKKSIKPRKGGDNFLLIACSIAMSSSNLHFLKFINSRLQ